MRAMTERVPHVVVEHRGDVRRVIGKSSGSPAAPHAFAPVRSDRRRRFWADSTGATGTPAAVLSLKMDDFDLGPQTASDRFA